MDPLTALSLAGTIVQFVDFGSTLLREARGLYQSSSGALTANEELELVTTDLRALVAKLQQSDNFNCLVSFEMICAGAVSTAQELFERLEKLKVKGIQGSRWDVFQKAVKGLWTKKEVNELVDRLSRFKDALDARMLLSLSEKVDIQTLHASSLFEMVDYQSQQIMSALLDQSVSHSNSLTQITAFFQLVCRLDGANQDEHHRTRELILQAVEERKREAKAQPLDHSNEGYEDIATYKLTTEIEGVSSSFEMTDISNAQESQLRNKTKKLILRSLRYEKMSHRYEDVVEAYPKTFEWIFHDSEEEQLPWENFTTLLKTGHGVYWIAGKAGSGKSTLMKHIFDDSRTRQHLRTWAQCRTLCVSSFFFWGSGTPEQRSQSGCLKALLFQILNQYPELIPIALPERWAWTYPNSIKENNLSEQSWSLSQLMAGLKRVVRQDSTPLALYLLVDGLDEFDGDHEEVVKLFTDLAVWDNFKACVASRPWVIFKETFSEYSNLPLQNLTYKDIIYYVKGRFSANISFRKLQRQQPEAAAALIEEVVDKADGVFLWVRLAVKSLLNEIQNRDDITILQARLKTLPRELESLYVHLIDLIEPQYLPWASKVFQIIRVCRELGTCYYHTSQPFIGVMPLTVASLYLALEECDKYSAYPCLSSKSMDEKYHGLEVHLAARAAGLPDVSHHSDGQVKDWSSVGYLHMTCQDYLESPSLWPKIVAHTAGSRFNPYAAMMKACTMLLESSANLDIEAEDLESCESPREEGEKGLIHSILTYARYIPPQDQVSMLNRLDHICVKLYASTSETSTHWSNKIFEQGESPLDSFLELAAIYQLRGYVEEKLKRHDPDVSKRKATNTLHKLLPRAHWGAAWPGTTTEMVTIFLNYGADINEKHDFLGTSIYENTIQYVLSSPLPKADATDQKRSLYPEVGEYIRILGTLLSRGANPYVSNGNAQDVNFDYVELETYWKQHYPEEVQDVLKQFKIISPENSTTNPKQTNQAREVEEVVGNETTTSGIQPVISSTQLNTISLSEIFNFSAYFGNFFHFVGAYSLANKEAENQEKRASTLGLLSQLGARALGSKKYG